MLKHLNLISVITFSVIILLSGCSSEHYQKDRTPENRDQYSGVEGAMQYQKDQGYLLTKELLDKCEAAKIDLAVAQTHKIPKEIEKQQNIIESSCR